MRKKSLIFTLFILLYILNRFGISYIIMLTDFNINILEVEKAHPDVLGICLQLFDEGKKKYIHISIFFSPNV